MKKKNIKYILIVALIFFAFIIIEVLSPKPIDWSFTLEKKDKIPYGTYILYNTLDEIFPGKKIVDIKKTTYEFLQANEIAKKNIIYISRNFHADEFEFSEILGLAEEGNNIFISSHMFADIIYDTLGFKTDLPFSFLDTVSSLNFYNRKIKSDSDFVYGKLSEHYFFSEFDSMEFEVLAYSKDKSPVFIRKKHGTGYIYLNTKPEVYTNYAMVAEENYEFAYNSLNYLPVRDIIWDEYYKPFRKQNKSALNHIFSNKGFKIAFLLLLIMTGLFALFTSKRKQRIIPIIKPHKNTTKAFVNTIGRLYFHSKNHKDIAAKKFNYLHNFLKTKYNIDITDNKTINYDNFAEKTGSEAYVIKKVLLTYSKINKLEKITPEQLNTFNNYIEDLYETCK